MSERRQEEKEEKQEKDEKDRGNQGWDEKWRNDPLSAAAWAGILIWAGLMFLAENLGFLGPLEPLSAWNLIFGGAGLIILLEAAVRLFVPAYRRPVGGSVIFGIILIAIGLGDIISWNLFWPLIIILIGAGLLLRSLLGR